MTEEGHKGGLVSRVKNKHSGKKYIVSTAQELGKDYWGTVVFPTFLFGFLPIITKKFFSIIRNNMDEARTIHWNVKKIVSDSPEVKWLDEIPNPEPPQGWSNDAKEVFRQKGVSENI